MQISKSQPIISIVIPVYNVQSYLAECLDSILLQTFQEFEVICIDNGSTDDSLAILEQYGQQDNRVHVVSHQRQYAGPARNQGLEMAQGEYIIFLDSDDFFAPEMLETIYQSAQEYQSDIVLFNGYQYSDKEQKIIKEGTFLDISLLPNKPVFSWSDVPDCIFNLSLNAPWCRLYSRKFLIETGLRFSTQQNAEDVCFTILSLALAERISVVQENLIYYRIERPNSLQYSNYENPLCFLSEYETIYHELIQRDLYIPLQTAFRYRILSSILYRLKSTKTDQARLQILDALNSEPYCDLPLHEIPGIDDGNQHVHDLSLQLRAAQAQYCRTLDAYTAEEQFDNLPQDSKTDTSIIVSVIIPVYNTELYLDETLTSITEQTLKDIEIICIDDGSTDGSLNILNRWAANDDRIDVISKPHRGQGYERDIGIKRARGKYIYFIDSDDLLEKDALKQLTTIMDEKELDSLYFDGETFYETIELKENYPTYQNAYTRSHSYDDVYDGPTLMRLFCEAGEYQVSPCLQINRLDFLKKHNLLFPIGIIHEDNLFTFSTMLQAKRVSHINHQYFKRRIRSDSVSTIGFSFQDVYGYYRVFWEMLKIYNAVVSEISAVNRTATMSRICSTLKRSQRIYANISAAERSGRLGLIENLTLFNTLTNDPGINIEKVKNLSNKVSEYTTKLKTSNEKLKESNEKRAQFYASLQKTREEKAEIKAKLEESHEKLKESNEKRAQFYSSLQKTREEKAEIKAKLEESHEKLKESNEKRAQFYASLQKTREEKAEIKAKLEESNEKLKKSNKQRNQFYASLQKTREEKISCDNQIKELQKIIENQNTELDAIHNSRSYRIGHICTWPVRKIKMIGKNSS